MSHDQLRQRVAIEAARLIFRKQEHDPYRATLRAARKMFRGWLKPDEFPSEAEIRMHLQQMSWMHEGDVRFDNLRELRLSALRLMRRCAEWSPLLVGSAAEGSMRRGRLIRIHLFANDPQRVANLLPENEVARLDVVKHRSGVPHPRTVFRFVDGFEFIVTCFPAECLGRTLKNLSTGDRVPTLTLAELDNLVEQGNPDGTETSPGENGANRFDVYRMLLAPLATVQQSKKSHPEGDALYHSLQVFELARNQNPYDEEFLLAALLHDVGKGIDPQNHVLAGLAALEGHITERTAWLIANHHDAHRLRDGTLGNRAKRRLRESADYDELLTLARCDDAGRVPGGTAPDIDAALDYIRSVARMCGESV